MAAQDGGAGSGPRSLADEGAHEGMEVVALATALDEAATAEKAKGFAEVVEGVQFGEDGADTVSQFLGKVGSLWLVPDLLRGL